MASRRPFSDAKALFAAAEEVWAGLGPADWMEAFSHHPRIGDKEGLRQRFATTRQWAAGEQSGVSEASEAVLEALAQGNRDYEARFGHIFIVCATGKGADEILGLLRERLGHDPETEHRAAAAEQARITRIRLEKLLAS
jgi:2-oxo-4-hydroxy-4-carboxy-5-ureidoimidazoline decarboxylase